MLPAIFWAVALMLAAIQVWAAVGSESMNADGVTYLDIADAYRRGDWAAAINSVWSPLYSWVLAFASFLGGDRLPELAIVHVTNFAVFILAFAGFSFLKRELGRHRTATSDEDSRPLPDWAWEALANLVFLWAALCLIMIWAVTPDMLMAVFVCVAAGLIVRIRAGNDRFLEFSLLGITLGAGYLAKSVMFPLSFAFLLAAFLASRDRRAAIPRLFVATAMFLLISAPWIVLISQHEGRPTFGEAGKLTYLRYVNGIPYPHWQGEMPELGRPEHPPRMVLEDPQVFEFGTPITATYPISYDPAFWYRGAQARFDLRQQTGAVLRNGFVYYDLFGRALGGVLAAALLLHVLCGRRRSEKWSVFRSWALLLPPGAALVLYALVYVETRYVGVFVALLCLELIANTRVRRATPSRVIIAGCGVMMLFLVANIVTFYMSGYVAFAENQGARSDSSHGVAASPAKVAESLVQLGLAPGDPVAVIGYAFDSFWARAARVRIVAELLDSQAGALWAGGAEVEQRVLDAFSAAGARAVVAEYVPRHAALPGWRRVGQSSFYVKHIDRAVRRN